MNEYYQFLESISLTPSHAAVLYYIYNNRVLYCKEERLTVLVKYLEISGYVYKTDKGEVFCTSKGNTLHAQLNEFFVSKVKTDIKLDKEYIEEYRELFPKGKQGSVPIKTNTSALTDKFKWFSKHYPEYGWDIIFKATKAYINSLEESADGFKYIKTAGYFIKKQDNDRTASSVLADWCQLVTDGDIEEEPTHFRTNVV